MTHRLDIAAGQYSDKGRKDINQDFHGLYLPQHGQLVSKGIAIAVADGIGSSDVSQVASQFAVTNFLEDYYCTSEAWSVKTSVERVLSATNSWLYSQTRQSQFRYDKDRGYVCTLSALVLKSTTAHVFHVGDSRIYHLRGRRLEQLTTDHRVSISSGQSYLSRALGINERVEIDYQTLQVEPGDLFVLATDGVYEHVDADFIVAALDGRPGDLDRVARAIADEAYRRGSADNLTIQLVRVAHLPSPEVNEIVEQLSALPFPPILEPRMRFDGYRIVRELHGSSRSHVYLAVDEATGERIVIKAPSIDLQSDAAYLDRFLTEEWIARRINSGYVLKPGPPARQRQYLYLAMEFIDGITLSQWMIDHPAPSIDTVRGIIEQIARGLRAFHRLEMLHQDLRPDNIMIDTNGTVKIIDFGSTRVAGIVEAARPGQQADLLGTPQHMAPEYFLGEAGTSRSDLFSLGVIAYQLLTGKLPYGAQVAKSRTVAAQRNLQYRPLVDEAHGRPRWFDEAIRKAVHPNPARRHADAAEFVFDLHHPNPAFLARTRPPLIERNPLAFWKGLCSVLLLVIVVLIGFHAVH